MQAMAKSGNVRRRLEAVVSRLEAELYRLEHGERPEVEVYLGMSGEASVFAVQASSTPEDEYEPTCTSLPFGEALEKFVNELWDIHQEPEGCKADLRAAIVAMEAGLALLREELTEYEGQESGKAPTDEG